MVQKMFEEKEEVHLQTFEKFGDPSLNWILSPTECCKKVLEFAKIEVKHINCEESIREVQRV